ncbi:uncharacterized protein PV09_04209 [Verruconis gallopava]|uniref:NAD-dependent epimerase/dehydratase domain-containing protein n=1 Tax=Verruconis gallopava TaxID=253628 RepID=A0A0D2B171_9PEZI|nr:uncharacterized protein PV09_04209 [Verruconis gallopava]KIW05054.1 hypothetical protein PV09_04209 [Verruconis gallopava]
MSPKIFITGITGYIGGSVFDAIVKRHPEYDVTAFVRKTPSDFEVKYPDVKLVYGTWDDSEILKKAASEADIVVQCGNSDHLGAVTALLDGLVARGKKSFYIHLSGTGILSDFKDPEGPANRGRLSQKVYNDLTGIAEVISRPDGSLHRHTDKAIQNAAAKHKDVLKTAIVCPPDIYGRGHGPGKRESIYFPLFIDEIKKLGYAFYSREGENLRGWVHIDDLVDVYIKLIEAAAAGGGNVTWGPEGYFFTTSQEASQKELATVTGRILHAKGLISSSEPKSVSDEVIEQMLKAIPYPDIGFYMFSNNSRAKPERAKKELGYEPKAPTLWETVEADIDDALRVT